MIRQLAILLKRAKTFRARKNFGNAKYGKLYFSKAPNSFPACVSRPQRPPPEGQSQEFFLLPEVHPFLGAQASLIMTTYTYSDDHFQVSSVCVLLYTNYKYPVTDYEKHWT